MENEFEPQSLHPAFSRNAVIRIIGPRGLDAEARLLQDISYGKPIRFVPDGSSEEIETKSVDGDVIMGRSILEVKTGGDAYHLKLLERAGMPATESGEEPSQWRGIFRTFAKRLLSGKRDNSRYPPLR